MDLLLVALLLLSVAGVVAVALGAVRGGMAPVTETLPPPLAGPLEHADDLDRARFTLALRGYRMDQVDAVLDEARDLLEARDAEIARLRGLVGHAGAHLAEPGDVQDPVPEGTPPPVPAPLAGEDDAHLDPTDLVDPVDPVAPVEPVGIDPVDAVDAPLADPAARRHA
ncbi:DivIVA domain-containing protein [Aquipuribacter hungaricus]|uniref:DivIVA domain-containing protein n=1 Tax=Aquipuribacter hungaricus TaxID=545624 RepID=A0ABV7WBB9_9MICO